MSTALIMNSQNNITRALSFLEKELVDEILQCSQLVSFPAGTTVIREGQFIKQLPVIIEGRVKVYSQFDAKELLLYEIMPKQSCIISFAAAIYNQPSSITAVTEIDTEILLIPAEKIGKWKDEFPRFNQLFFDLYHMRYLDLLETVNQLIFNSLDERLINYLLKEAQITGSNTIRLKHHQIARDLGTAREVISRTLKKLEKENKILQTSKGIKILDASDLSHQP